MKLGFSEVRRIFGRGFVVPEDVFTVNEDDFRVSRVDPDGVVFEPYEPDDDEDAGEGKDGAP